MVGVLLSSRCRCDIFLQYISGCAGESVTKSQVVDRHLMLGMSAAQWHLRRRMCWAAQVTLSSTMGPGVPVLLPSLAQVVDASVVA